MLAEAREWLTKAAEDLRAADLAWAARPPIAGAAVFHCQQTAEKAVKGFLTLHGRVFRKSHSIEEIGASALAVDRSLRIAIERAAPLTEYAWKFRYPGSPGEPSSPEVTEALAAARQLFQEIVERLPEAARP